jgi:hypothetical protein
MSAVRWNCAQLREGREPDATGEVRCSVVTDLGGQGRIAHTVMIKCLRIGEHCALLSESKSCSLTPIDGMTIDCEL